MLALLKGVVTVYYLSIYWRGITIEATHPSLTARRRRRFCDVVPGSSESVKTAPAGVPELISIGPLGLRT
jgi:hypothetical protein